MKITWEISDGYAGGSAPHHLTVPNDELAECESEQERENLIEEYVQEDFADKISWYITGRVN